MSGKYAPPAFQFYARSYLEGCAHMTLAEQGAYMRLLCHQWERGVLPDDPDLLARLLGLTRRAFDRIWVGIADKFPGSPPANPTLEDVRAKQQAYADSRRRNRLTHVEHMSKTMPPLQSPVSSLPSERRAVESITPPATRTAATGGSRLRTNNETPGSERRPGEGGGMTKLGDLLPRTTT